MCVCVYIYIYIKLYIYNIYNYYYFSIWMLKYAASAIPGECRFSVGWSSGEI